MGFHLGHAMPLVIRSETLHTAPDGRSNSRLTVGVGEPIAFRTDPIRAAHWTVEGNRTRNAIRDHAYVFNRPGEFAVLAEVGHERAEVRFTVVAPSLRYEKVSEPTVPNGVTAWLARNGRPLPPDLVLSVGVAMELRVLLTPLSVSFAALQVRERNCTPTAIWGVYVQGTMVPPHTATPTWTDMGADNALVSHDLAAACWIPSRLSWPIPAGGYRWDIPVEYRVGGGGTPVPFPTTVPQTVRYDPLPGAAGNHNGTFAVDKGGCSARARV